MSEVVNELYTFPVKIDDAQFQALRDHLRPSTWNWGKPRLNDALMEQIEVFGSALSRAEDWTLHRLARQSIDERSRAWRQPVQWLDECTDIRGPT